MSNKPPFTSSRKDVKFFWPFLSDRLFFSPLLFQGSLYFRSNLFELKTYHEVVDEIYYKVTHLEPWEKGSRKTTGQTGMCGGVSGWFGRWWWVTDWLVWSWATILFFLHIDVVSVTLWQWDYKWHCFIGVCCTRDYIRRPSEIIACFFAGAWRRHRWYRFLVLLHLVQAFYAEIDA